MTDKRNNNNEDQDNSFSQPDQETLNTTDPQENMDGPVSNMIQEAGDVFDSSDKTKEEADEKKDRGL